MARVFGLIILSTGLALGAASAQATAIPTVIIMDGSRSMTENVAWADTSRMALTRNFVHDMVNVLDPQDVSLVVFAQRFSSNNCRDVEVRVRLGAGTTSSLQSEINRVRPYGGTPLAHAMRVAAEQFAGIQGPKRILVLTDGADSCDEDPHVAQAELLARGIEVRFITFEDVDIGVSGDIAAFNRHLNSQDLIGWVNGDPLPLPSLLTTHEGEAANFQPPVRLDSAGISLAGRELARRMSGQVDLLVFIDLTGQVQDVILLQSSGEPMLDDIAVASAWQWIFEAARQDGGRVAAETETSIVFSAGGDPQIIDGGT